MPINDPALGLSGALTTMQGQPSMAATANLSRAEGAAGAGELASAARSLESVQGNVSGQTMAIQQMTMSGQQQATNLNMLLNQLSTQVAGLNQAVMQMAGATRMAAMPMPAMQQPMSMGLPGPAIPPPPMMGGGGFRGAMGAGFGYAAQGVGLAGAGLGAFGGAFGRVGAGLAQPFLGAHIYNGPNGPQLGQDVGFMRSMGLASGIGVHPDMLKTASATQIGALGRERMQNRFQDAAMGTIGGLGHFGLAIGGEAAASSMLGAMGIGGLAGFGGSILLGGGIAAAGGMAINETMRQTANIRGFGEQFGRNAYRFMDVGGGGRGANGLRMPSRSSRAEFGRAMNRMSIDDLVFNDQDVTEMFAGMSEQDLMRGMRSTQEVVQRMRQAKETFKLIGQQMGQGIQEASQTMGIMQGLGGNPMGAQGRAMIFGASSIPGLMPGEAMGRMGQFGQQFVGAGAGMEGAQLMEASLRGGQLAINRGRLTAREIAALGGREGVGGSMANLTALYAQSSMGQASMMAGGGAMGADIFSTMGMGATRAMDPNRIIELQAGDLQKDFLGAGGGFGAQADMYAKLKSQADVLKNSLGLTDRNAMVAALRQIPGNNNMTGAQADALIKQMENIPQAMRDKQRAMVQQASEQMHSQAVEQFSPWARFKRGAQRAFTPLAEGTEEMVRNAGSEIGRWTENIDEAISGRESVNLSLGVQGKEGREVLQSLRGRGRRRFQMESEISVPATADRQTRAMIEAQNRGIKERNRIRSRQEKLKSAAPTADQRGRYTKMAQDAYAANKKKIEGLKQVLNDPGATSGEKRQAMKEALQVLSKGAYENFDAMDGQGALNSQRALQDAAQTILGVSPAGALTGTELGGSGGMTVAEKEELTQTRDRIQEIMKGTKSEAMALESPEVQAYINALQSETGVAPARDAAIEAGVSPDVLSKIETLHSQRDDWQPYWRAFEGESRWESLLGVVGGKKGERLTMQSRKDSAQGRVQILGRELAGLMKDGGFKGLDIGGLGNVGFDENIGQLGALTQKMTTEDIKLLKGIKGGEKFAKVLGQLNNVRLEGGINEKEAAILKQFGLSDKEISEIKTEEQLGIIAASALDQGDMTGLTTSVSKKTGITSMQAGNMQQMANQLLQITDLLNQMKEHPAFNRGE